MLTSDTIFYVRTPHRVICGLEEEATIRVTQMTTFGEGTRDFDPPQPLHEVLPAAEIAEMYVRSTRAQHALQEQSQKAMRLAREILGDDE